MKVKLKDFKLLKNFRKPSIFLQPTLKKKLLLQNLIRGKKEQKKGKRKKIK